MYSFEGDFRRKPLQSLRGASKKEQKDVLLQRAHFERQKRETQRQKLESSVKIQSWFRGCKTRRTQASQFRKLYDEQVRALQTSTKIDVSELNLLTSQLLYFYSSQYDGQRLTWLCQQILKLKENYIALIQSRLAQVEHQLKAILAICLRYLEDIAPTSTPIAIPMRMLEVFTAPDTYTVISEKSYRSQLQFRVYNFLVKKGYFSCMKTLMNEKVPASIDKTTEPPTPVAASIFDLIMKPIYFAASSSDKQLSRLVLTAVCKALLCPSYTEQVGQFLLPAMAYSKYPFPLVELIQALITDCDVEEPDRKTPRRVDSGRRNSSVTNPQVPLTPWLLCAILTLGERELGKLTDKQMLQYLIVLKRLIQELPPPKLSLMDVDDSDSEEEDMIVDDQAGSYSTLEELREECLRLLDAPDQVKVILTCIIRFPMPATFTAVCTICHIILSQQRLHVHKTRLLYSLAFNANFIKHLWKSCLSVSALSVTGSQTPLLQILSGGLQMNQSDIDRIIPMLSVFCSLFSHSLLTLHDAEFYGGFKDSNSSSMPFDLYEFAPMTQALRDGCLGIIQLAHPDSKPVVHEDYREALQRTGIRTRQEKTEAEEKQTAMWAYLFKVIAHLVRQLYKRDARRAFCPPNHWLAPHVSIKAERPAQLYRAQREMFVRRPLGALRSLAQTKVEDEGPPLSNKEIRNLIVLTEVPFVIAFQERVKVLQRLINKDKEEFQNDVTHFLSGPAISVMIRRNYVYEDAFEKLSKDNEPNLKLKMRIQLVNAAGLDEAGIDGGGIFREFLSQLLKTAFDPNRGFFKYTTDRLLYPNPQAKVLTADYLKHYFFVGRMLGKAIYENMLAELAFASFFLSKILSRHSGDLDIHHLASMDPEMYKNLLFLKSYDGDVSDLGLDFSVLRNDFGEAKLEDLKAGGRNIAVNNSNRIEYIHLMADYLLNKQIRQHCHAFREGMSDVIDLDWLRMFDHHELQVLISGASVPVNIDDLKQYTNYSGGYTADHPVIKLFWKVVADFTDQQKRQLLKFVTSCSRSPLLGFKDLYPAFCVHYAGSEVERLPTASTCMNLLKLPEFKDEQTMRSKLVYAVESESGFELS